MITPFLRALEQVFGWLLTASWQASVLALCVLLIQGIVGARLNPRWRYALWMLVVLRLVLPALPASGFSLFQFAPPAPVALTASVTEPLFVSAPTLPLANVPTAIPAPTPSFSFYSLLAVVWLAGALILLVLTWQVNRRFSRQVANSPAISDPGLLRLFAGAKTELAIRRAIRLIENGHVQSPAIMGLFQPTLLLPSDVREKFDARELRFIFLHELAHLKRGDVMVQALIALLQILHWFNPVLWFAFRRMRIDREPATDALVLSRTGEAEKEPYGLMLIKLLEHFNQRHSLPTLVGILEDKDQFKRRFSLIAKFTRGAYGWSLLGIMLIGILAAVCLTKDYHTGHVTDPALPAVIDLKPFYNRVFLPDGSDSTFHGYAGRKTIDGLPFDINGKIQLFGRENADRNKDYPDAVSGIKIGHKFDELHLVHAAEWREYYGCPVAIIRLHYADGTRYDFPVRFDFQVNDWSRLFTEDAEIVADPDTKIIWRGAGTAEGTGRLFKSVLRNPFPNKQVDSMDLISTRSGCTYVLVAATVAPSNPQREVTPPMPLLPPRHFDGTLNVHVIDATTGAPIAGAEVYPAMIIGDISLVADNVLTGPDGVAPVKYPRDGAKDLRVKVAKAGYLTCEDNWENGWNAGSIPPEVTYQLAAGRDPILDAHRVIGHWKRGPGLPDDVDVTQSMHLYLAPKVGPPPFPPEADTPDKKQKWLQDWLTTDAGRKYKEMRRRGRLLDIKADGTFVGQAVAPGDYVLSGSVMDQGQIKAQIQNTPVTVPPNPGNDPDAPVDLGSIVISGSQPNVYVTPSQPVPSGTNAPVPQTAAEQVPDEGRLYHALVYQQSGPSAQLAPLPYQFIADIRNTFPDSLGLVSLPAAASWATNPVKVVDPTHLVGAHYLYTQGFDSLDALLANFPNGSYIFKITRAQTSGAAKSFDVPVAFWFCSHSRESPGHHRWPLEFRCAGLSPSSAAIHYATEPGVNMSWEVVDRAGGSAGGWGSMADGTLDLTGFLVPGRTYDGQLRFVRLDNSRTVADPLASRSCTYSTLAATIVEFTLTTADDASGKDIPAAKAHADADAQMQKAVEKGDAVTLQKLIDQGGDPNKVEDRGQPLIFAAGSADVAEILLRHGANPNALDKQKDPALCYLLRNKRSGGTAIARVLLEHGADPNIRSGELEETPLMDARDGAAVDLLIAHGADIHLKMTDGAGVIDMAPNHPLNYFQALLRHGVPFDVKTDGPTLLLHASWTSNLPMMKEMIDRGVDPNVEGVWATVNGKADRMLPMTAAAVDGQPQAAKFLLAHGAKADDQMITAMHNGNNSIVKLFWESGVRSVSELCYDVSQKAPVADLQKLLDEGVPADPPQDTEITPLGEAARLGDMEAVKLLVAHHADVNSGGPINPKLAQLTRMSPLWLAASEGQDEVVTYLLQQGARPEPEALWQAAENSTPYAEQRSKDHFEKTVRILIDAGAAKNLKPEMAGIILASSLGTRQGPPNATVLKMLLDAGLSPQAPMPYIVENGEKPNSVIGYYRDYYRKYKDDPVRGQMVADLKPLLDLLEAADQGSLKTTGTGVSHPADPAPKNSALDQALVQVARDGRTDKVGKGDADKVAQLLAQGADPNAKSNDGNSALVWALNFGKDDAAQVLIQHGADAGAEDARGENAAWLAASIYFCPGALELMVQKGVDVKGLDKNGNTIFSAMITAPQPAPGKMNYLNDRAWTDAEFQAHEERERRTVDLLLAAGVDINGRSGPESKTPLMLAAQRGHVEMARELIKHGADVSLKDSDGETAATLAQMFGHPECLPLLEAKPTGTPPDKEPDTTARPSSP